MISHCFTKYFTMDKVQMHAGAISKLLYGLCVCTGDNQLLKLMDYLLALTHTPYHILHLLHIDETFVKIYHLPINLQSKLIVT